MAGFPDPQELLKLLMQAHAEFAAGAKTIADDEIREHAMGIASEWEKSLPQIAEAYPEAVREMEGHMAKGEQAAAHLREEAARMQAHVEQYEADLQKAMTPPVPEVEMPLPSALPPLPTPMPTPLAVPESEEGSIWRDNRFLDGAESRESKSAQMDELIIEDEVGSTKEAKPVAEDKEKAKKQLPAKSNPSNPQSPRPKSSKGEDMWDPGLTDL